METRLARSSFKRSGMAGAKSSVIFFLMPSKNNSLFQLAVVVSALGFFVDVYDLLLFGIIRKPSLTDLGLSPAEVLTQGELIISIQMMGLLVGGILWGIIGDKKGRLNVLFGSILIYSIANILKGISKNPTKLSTNFVS